jgi:hypothetical protein
MNNKSTIQYARHAAKLTGVTLVEVLFAMVIVLVGLLGVAALIPLAGRQANDSYTITHASAEGQNWYRNLLFRNLKEPQPTQPWLVADDVTTGSLVSVPTPSLLDANEAYCIDPLFWSGQPVSNTGGIGLYDSTVTGAFRRAYFPYFTTNYSPFSLPISNDTTRPVNVSWAFQPRMHRVTFPSAAGGLLPIPAKVAESLFTTSDDLVVPKDEKDESLNGILGYFNNAVGGIGQVASQRNLSWMATLVPMEIDSATRPDSYTLSIIVFNRRNRRFEAPGSPIPYDAPPDDERTALVIVPAPTSGSALPNSNYSFSGGNGFSAGLIGAEYGERKVGAGSWVMLSRQFTFPGSGNVRHIHKWFKVVAANAKVSTPPTAIQNGSGGYDDPFTGASIPANNLWYQQVNLMGPDWIFQIPVSGTTPLEPTIATIVPDVVAVYERVIQVK